MSAPCVRLKSGVELHGLQPAGVRLLAEVDRAARVLGVDLTVTCATEAHAPGNPHTRGCAIDVRTRDLTEAQILVLVSHLRQALGPSFTVLYEVLKKPIGVLAGIATVNPGASAPHLHLQVNKRYQGEWPDGALT